MYIYFMIIYFNPYQTFNYTLLRIIVNNFYKMMVDIKYYNEYLFENTDKWYVKLHFRRTTIFR